MFEPEDLQEKLNDIGYTLKHYDIVLIRCDADKRLHDDDYVKIHMGASAAATHWLIDQGIKVMGIDGWDIPLHIQAADYKANPRPGVIWQAHYVGIEKEYCQIEKLANLDQLPPYGFKVACFPVRGNKNIGLYGISKAGLVQLAKNLAVEYGPNNIRVNAISPGLIDTPFAASLTENEAFMKKRLELTPLRRVGTVDEVAGVAVMLASKAGEFITGQNIIIDGGTTISDGN